MEHRRLKILFAIISLFASGVIAWYFLFSTPKPAPTLEGTADPLSVRDLPARLGFIFLGNSPETTTETEVIPAGSQPFIQIWDKPSTGNIFVSRSVLREITATTTVGTSTVLTTKTVRATTTVLMFVDRMTGYVYGHDIDSGTTYQISNTTLPGIYDAYIWAGGDRVLMRYLDTDKKTIVSILATLPNVQSGRDAQPLVGLTTLPNNISSVAVSSSLASLSYVVPNDLGSSIYTITAKGTARVADSSFSEWTLSYGGEKVYATTRASAYVEGMTVSLPSFMSLISGKTGLLSTPSQGDVVLASMWSRSGLTLFSIDKGKTVVSSLKTLAPKCTPMTPSYYVCGVPKSLPLSSEGLPDDWYQGRVMFDDKLVMVETLSGEADVIYDIDEKFGATDITHIAITRTADLVSFIRKQDGSLFLLNTKLLAD